ncbi:phosphoribosylamine--glycine ligase [Limnothrix sp. FACHB-881]|uniref:phosphoribosylamine--glycine ligase n=1 Tax=Limnothrix sp. FACHB-881 TaxID=2692819 RepID=UPI00168917E1|nr:phosphoribosylamine--glycine ligase [Limnothrix sp. FACHB-881]
MKVLVVGNGGREHTIAHMLLKSEQVERVFCIPGNGGTALNPRCQNFAFAATDFEAIARVAQTQGVSLVVVGPEAPLAVGIVDFLRGRQIPVFGPTQAGAQIEASKSWAKTLMAEAGVPTAQSATFTELAPARDYLQQTGAPIVVKADGLAAGKGVTVAMTLDEALKAVESIFGGQFGSAGSSVVIEEFMEGREVSVLALTDGKAVRPLIPAQDHKRIGEGDTGPNTGGMGTYAPAPLVTPDLMARIETEVLQPTVRALAARGIDYRGVLYAGLMITPEGDPKVVEFNCRFGDPETQVVLPLLETPLHELMLACVEQRLAQFPPIAWKSGVAGCVVVAAQGYPGSFAKGTPIAGLAEAEAVGAMVFHAGTRLVRSSGNTDRLVSDGGRVLGVTAIGADFDEAFGTVYRAIEAIDYTEKTYRRDIGYQVRQQPWETLPLPGAIAASDPMPTEAP